MPAQTVVVTEESFAPILYIMRYEDLKEAIAMHNGVAQGLVSCFFTTDLHEAERFLARRGSIAASPTSISAPAAPKMTPAAAADLAPKAGEHMHRVTNTIKYSSELPLAQGIVFDTG